MQVTGVMLVFVDVPRERALEFNRWYDLDHLPEMCGTGDVLAARRYFAGDAIQKYRFDKLENAPPIAPARYCAIYLLGSTDLEGVKGRMAKFGERMIAEKRALPSYARTTYFTIHRLVRTQVAPGSKVSEQAAPYIGHQGLQLAMGYALDAVHAAEVAAWWDSTQYPQMLSVPGWAAALRCEPVGEEGRGKFMHLFLLDAPAAEGLEQMEKKLLELRARGASMHPHYQRIFSGPYSAITPLSYEFLR